MWILGALFEILRAALGIFGALDAAAMSVDAGAAKAEDEADSEAQGEAVPEFDNLEPTTKEEPEDAAEQAAKERKAEVARAAMEVAKLAATARLTGGATPGALGVATAAPSCG